MNRRPQLIALEQEAGERVLAPQRIRGFYLFFLPLVFALFSCGAGGWFFYDANGFSIPGIALVAAGFLLGIGYIVFETFFISVIPARCYLRWLRQRIEQRADAIVDARDPDAYFVQHIPRKNWDVTIGENATDVGLLLLDHRNGLLKYEGDAERWIIPAESICSFRLESFTPGSAAEVVSRYTVVMLRIEPDEDADLVVRPLAVHPLRWRPWTPGARERGARRLREAIGHFIDPQRWPRPTEEDLQLLVPPAD